MLHKNGTVDLHSAILALAPLRFGLPNLLMALFLVALVKGGNFAWLVLGVTLVGWSVGDEIQGDDTNLPAAKSHWLYDFSLYMTLPMIIAISAVYIDYLAPRDLLGLDSLGSHLFARRVASAGSVISATIGVGMYYGLAANTVAHELIHRTHNPFAMAVGRILLAFSFEASFPMSHVDVHHRKVGTLVDHSTARRGETVYAFAGRMTAGSLRAAFDYEARRLARRGKGPWNWHNRMVRGEILSLLIPFAFAYFAGMYGFIGFVLACGIGKLLLIAISYTQHYGIVRVDGTPIAERHSWDSYRPISNALLYNLPRHSDHHQHAWKSYCELETTSQAPHLPYGYQTMALLAFLPPLWNRIMHPLLGDWDRRLASETERRLLSERGWMTKNASNVLA